MTMISTESVDCKVCETFEDSAAYGKGGIRYWYAEGSQKRFPEDVTAVVIEMPVTWAMVYPEKNDLHPEHKDNPVDLSWAVKHPDNERHGVKNQWTLSGTYDKPTLSPSLFWLPNVWHGHLRNGRLESC